MTIHRPNRNAPDDWDEAPTISIPTRILSKDRRRITSVGRHTIPVTIIGGVVSAAHPIPPEVKAVIQVNGRPVYTTMTVDEVNERIEFVTNLWNGTL